MVLTVVVVYFLVVQVSFWRNYVPISVPVCLSLILSKIFFNAAPRSAQSNAKPQQDSDRNLNDHTPGAGVEIWEGCKVHFILQ